MSQYFICPHCGVEVDYNALSCPECGSDEHTGWSEDTKYDDLFIGPDPEENYTIKNEKRVWVRYAVLILLAVILASFVTATIPLGIYLVPIILLAPVAAYFILEILPNLSRKKHNKLYDTLLLKARGDEAMVERWISFERRRTPDADEIELMEAALYRWQRDNR